MKNVSFSWLENFNKKRNIYRILFYTVNSYRFINLNFFVWENFLFLLISFDWFIIIYTYYSWWRLTLKAIIKTVKRIIEMGILVIFTIINYAEVGLRLIESFF